MTTSTPASISKNKPACRCDKNCGCCARKALRRPGLLGRHPWLWVVFAFGLMFTAWGVMFNLAMKHQPEVVPLTTGAAPQ